MSLLGIDLGTSGCKAAAFAADGRCLAWASREYPTLHPHDGWAELDSREVWAQTRAVIAEVAAQTAHDPIAVLSVSSLGEAMVPVSARRELLGNSILFFDRRGEEYVTHLRERYSPEAFYRINPNILGAGYSLPKLMWVRDHQPELFAATDKFLLWGDAVLYLLGGEACACHSLANRTLLFDLRAEDWSDELLEWSGITRAQLGRTVPAGTLVGEVAADVGLPRGVKLVAGGHDQCLNALGAGVAQPGRAVCGLGSVECITPAYARLPEAAAMLAQGLNIEHHVVPGLYVSFLYNQAGALVRWFRDTFAATESFDHLMAEMPEEPTRLLCLPYFEMTGTPDFKTDAAGAVIGLHTSTPRGVILKGILEGATFHFVGSLAGLRALGVGLDELVATGGGARSDAWLQLTADMLGIPVVRPRVTEAGLLGAAMLAGGPGVRENWMRRERVFEPHSRRHHQYQERYTRYREFLSAALPLMAHC